MATVSTPKSTKVALPRPLQEAIVDLAIAVHKRSIYPPGHPIQKGAVEGVLAKLIGWLVENGDLAIGVAERQLLVGGIATDDAHPLLTEFATRLRAHQVGALRFVPGMEREELQSVIDVLAAPPDAGDGPAGDRVDLSWQHIAVVPIRFDRLALLGQDSTEDMGAAPEEAMWRALAEAAIQGREGDAGGDIHDPRVVAEAIHGAALSASGHGGQVDPVVVDRLSALLESLGNTKGSRSRIGRKRASDLVSGIGPAALGVLLKAAGSTKGKKVVRTANDTLATGAVMDLVRAASDADAVSISHSMFRLLMKLSNQVEANDGGSSEADRLLRSSIRKLIDGWTLENPNPEMYDRVLEEASARDGKHGSDQHRDVPEPERIVDIALESQSISEAVDDALTQMMTRDGLASVVERLQSYPPSPARESIVDRLLNEASLREYLNQPYLDLPLLRQAMDRMRERALQPLIESLETRPDADTPGLSELIVRIGPKALPGLGEAMPMASLKLLRALIGIFDRFDAWPPQVSPKQFATHSDAAVRRETIKYLLKDESAREVTVLIALRDKEVRIFSLALTALPLPCPSSAARLLMARYLEPTHTSDLRVRMIRAIGSAGGRDVLQWLTDHVMTKTWLLRRIKLRRASDEALAAAAAIVAHYPESDAAADLTRMAGTRRGAEYRRTLFKGVA